MSTVAERQEQIAEMCRAADCKEKIRKIHFDQYVYHKWHPHPPVEFEWWWAKQPEFTVSDVQVKPAWNCQIYRDKFLESRQYGGA